MAENQQKPAGGKSETALREESILKLWEERDISRKVQEKSATKGEFIFYEGPPTANGRPGIHHLESRAFKDAVLRFRTMQGYHARRKGGWDTHGLPVELEVEKEIGSKGKKDIEAFGVAEFNKKCKESVVRYIDEWEKFTDRIAFWTDKKPYFTFENSYIEAVWNILKTAHARELLYKDYKVVPWCPRCGTALSSHEVAQGYAETKDRAVYVKFKVKNPSTSLGASEYILAWTTTPWTLPGNVALAVGADITYVKARTENGNVWLAKSRLEAVAPGAEILEEASGADLVGMEYEPLYLYLKHSAPVSQHTAIEEKAYRVYAADFVSTEDGTGIVHTAVMYGTDDFELGTKIGLPKHHLVNEDGKFSHQAGPLAGKFVKDADNDIITDLSNRRLLFAHELIEHTYPFCWRCKTPLIYYARDSWYIRMSEVKDVLIRENETIHWEPEHIRDGRFGEWLRDLKDWAISRSRYWGTPLPIWECERCKAIEVIGSIKELHERSAQHVPENLDLHKPFIDMFTLECECGGSKKRVPEVLDVWFDSGSMPFAQDADTRGEEPLGEFFKKVPYPADYIVEAIDQTRGWFYTLHAVGAGIMGRGKAFKNVICLGHVLDAKGKKMSKSVGNVVVPDVAIEKYGVDALRYFMYTVNAPGDSKNFDERLVDDIVKKNLGRLGNVLAFWKLYDPSAGSTELTTSPLGASVPRDWTSKNILDRWIIARMDELVLEMTDGFEKYQLDAAMRPIAKFIDDLSVWYLRRSRERFKEEGSDPSTSLRTGKKAALSTLRFVLHRLSLLMAPAMPFFAEHLFQAVREGEDEESVHLAMWPEVSRQSGLLARLFGGGDKNRELIAAMQLARDIVSRALDAREKAGINIRQPLPALTYSGPVLGKELAFVIAGEVNVKNIRHAGANGAGVALDTTLTAALKEEGLVREARRLLQGARRTAKLSPNDMARKAKLYAAGNDVAVLERHKEELKKMARVQELVIETGDAGAKIEA